MKIIITALLSPIVLLVAFTLNFSLFFYYLTQKELFNPLIFIIDIFNFYKFYVASSGDIADGVFTGEASKKIGNLYADLELFAKNPLWNSEVKASVGFYSSSFPIYLFRNKTQVGKKVLIVAGIHGNEPSSYFAIASILSVISKNSKIFNDLQISVLAPLNPVGFAYNKRYNESGIDLNRDFKDFNSTGAKVQKEVIEQWEPNLVIALHEGPQKGFLTISEYKTNKNLAREFIEKFNSHNSSERSAKFTYLKFPIKQKGLWQKGSTSNFIQTLLRLNTLGTFCDEKKIDHFTFETPEEEDLKERVQLHQDALLNLLNAYENLK